MIPVFTLINLWSVKGMGKIEDLLVFTKLLILVAISFVLIKNSHTTLPVLIQQSQSTSMFSVLIVASLTFVAYEGFQLVINAVNEMESPEKNIPRAIYSAIFLAILIYVVIALGALLATSSAISGTVFGASRQMAVIASDGYLPALLAKRINQIFFIGGLYALLTLGAWLYSKGSKRH